MTKKFFTTLLAVGLAAAMSLPVAAYDTTLAEGYAKLFEPVAGAQTG